MPVTTPNDAPPAAPAPLRKQVDASHYRHGYDTPKRFVSYWHQIDLALRNGPRNALEIGPGSGFLSSYLRRAGLSLTTLDIDPELGPNVSAALPDLPFPDASFDLVIAYEVLEHIPFEHFEACLREMRRVSRGDIALSLPDAERTFRLSSSFSKLWSFGWTWQVPRLIAPKHRFDGEHHWEIGKRGFRQRRILDTMHAAGLEVRTHWRVPEHPYHHFFDLRKRP